MFVFCRVLFFFKQKTAYEITTRLVGSEMCIRDRSTILVTSGDWKTVNLQGGARCDGVTSGSHQVPVYKAL